MKRVGYFLLVVVLDVKDRDMINDFVEVARECGLKVGPPCHPLGVRVHPPLGLLLFATGLSLPFLFFQFRIKRFPFQATARHHIYVPGTNQLRFVLLTLVIYYFTLVSHSDHSASYDNDVFL